MIFLVLHLFYFLWYFFCRSPCISGFFFDHQWSSRQISLVLLIKSTYFRCVFPRVFYFFFISLLIFHLFFCPFLLISITLSFLFFLCYTLIWMFCHFSFPFFIVLLLQFILKTCSWFYLSLCFPLFFLFSSFLLPFQFVSIVSFCLWSCYILFPLFLNAIVILIIKCDTFLHFSFILPFLSFLSSLLPSFFVFLMSFSVLSFTILFLFRLPLLSSVYLSSLRFHLFSLLHHSFYPNFLSNSVFFYA